MGRTGNGWRHINYRKDTRAGHRGRAPSCSEWPSLRANPTASLQILRKHWQENEPRKLFELLCLNPVNRQRRSPDAFVQSRVFCVCLFF